MLTFNGDCIRLPLDRLAVYFVQLPWIFGKGTPFCDLLSFVQKVQLVKDVGNLDISNH